MRFEYKTICLQPKDLTVSLFSLKICPEKLDKVINEYSSQGWELATSFPIVGGSMGLLQEMYLTFRKQA